LDSPELIDHLVTFIACEIITGRRLTEILGTHPSRLGVMRPLPRRFRHVALRYPCLLRLPRPVPANMGPTGQPERQGAMTIEKCINE
jgi:hypothetical protein